MALVTIARYRVVTGDTTSASATIEEALADAVEALEEKLGGRPLEQMERTETMWPDRAARLWPKATPLASVAADSGLQIDGASLIGVAPFPLGADFISGATSMEVTYTGGFLERTANPDDPARLPMAAERDLCWAAWTLMRPELAAAAASVPVGVTTARVGDAAVGYGPDGPPAGGGNVRWSRETLRLSRVGRRVPRAVGTGPGGTW